jgi:hypothetical protein
LILMPPIPADSDPSAPSSISSIEALR